MDNHKHLESYYVDLSLTSIDQKKKDASEEGCGKSPRDG